MSLQQCAQHAVNSNKKAIAYNKNERSCYLALDEQAGQKANGWSVYRVKGGVKTPAVLICDDTHECNPPDKWDIKTGRHNIELVFGTFMYSDSDLVLLMRFYNSETGPAFYAHTLPSL